MGVRPPVHQDDGRTFPVAFFVHRDSNAVRAVDELLGCMLCCRHQTSATWDLLSRSVATPYQGRSARSASEARRALNEMRRWQSDRISFDSYIRSASGSRLC